MNSSNNLHLIRPANSFITKIM